MIDVIFNGSMVAAPIVGSYGTQGYPIVDIGGSEYVAEPCFHRINSGKIEVLSTTCQSCGCDFCKGDYLGCRYGELSRMAEAGYAV